MSTSPEYPIYRYLRLEPPSSPNNYVSWQHMRPFPFIALQFPMVPIILEFRPICQLIEFISPEDKIKKRKRIQEILGISKRKKS